MASCTLFFLFLSLSAPALAQVTPATPQAPATGGIPLTPPNAGEIPLPPPQEPVPGEIPMTPPAVGGIPFLPEIPGIIGIGLPPRKGSGGSGKEKCGACKSGCMKKKRNRWGYAACMASCAPKCIGIMSESDSEFHCIQSCALSASPRVFSDSDEGNNYINYCYQSCRN